MTILRALSLRTWRTVVAVFIVLDLLVLALFSVHRSTTTTTTTLRPAAGQLPVAASTSPTPSASPVASVAPVPVPPAPEPVLAVPVAAVSTPAPTLTTPPRTTEPRPASPTPRRTPSSPAPSASGATPAAASCPIKLTDQPVPAGGLESLIDLAPAFGQFSAEAFAAASAYQPVLQLLGPILAQYPSLAPTLAPVVGPLVSVLQLMTNSGFALLEPLYTPYRQQVLQSETALAAALAPYAEKLATSPLGGCVEELETVLVAAGK